MNLPGIVADLAQLKDDLIIVHGANAWRDELAVILNKPKKIITSVSGYDSVYSDESAIDLLLMAYAGLRNKRLVELCQGVGINAIGLTGIDGQVIRGRRNPGIRVREGDKTRIIRDLSGKPIQENQVLLELLIRHGYTPVLTVPIIDENRVAINSENDEIVSLLQKSFRAAVVVQMIEAPGFLADSGDSSSLIPRLTPPELTDWEEQVNGRMKRKLHALRKLFDYGAMKVIIADGRVRQPVRDAFSGRGTVIEPVT